MSSPKMVKQWFTYAVRDLKSAKALIAMGSDYKIGAAFFAQQCVEKSVKGYLVHKGVRPPKWHSLKALSKLIVPLDPELAKKIRSCNKLSKYAVEYRYPDAVKRTLTMAKSRGAVNLAKKMYDLLLSEVQF